MKKERPAFDETIAALTFVDDPFNDLTFFRCYSGMRTKFIHVNTKGKRERIGRILQIRHTRKEIETVTWNIAAAVGLKIQQLVTR